ncbi:MAG: DNA primase [Brucellaceae bacterium]|nr:DNA primase [Brucellaceae bacterium]
MRFSTSFLDEIRDRVPISSVIGQRVTWDRKKSQPSKGDYWACCPFHGEKTPSFHCEDRKGRYHCFGCGVSGDHFKFLTELDGMSFPEAVERVADMAGVPMPARDPEAEKREKQRASLHEVMEMAAAFFEAKLQEAVGASARSYLRERGLSAATQQTFRLGFAPDSRNALKEHLTGKGVAMDQIEACGLVRHGPDIPVSYDWFRGRIMFPIPDSRGRIIAFGGRALSPDVPAKYMNSPETELFHKGRVLYNFARARAALQKGGRLIAVEGYMDVIALAQAGIETAVAPLGTALTEDQLELLWRVSSEPVLSFDGDSAGLRAAYRAADLALPALQRGRSLWFALLPEGKDPDDVVKGGGKAAFDAVLEDARPLADMVWARETSGGVYDTPERRAELEQTLREVTNRIRDENVRRHYQQDMRDRTAAFFGRSQGGDRGRGGGNGNFGGGRPRGRGHAPGRFAVSESLARSRLVRSSAPSAPLRETALVMIGIHHPAIVDMHFDDYSALELDHAELKAVQRAALDAIAEDGAHDGDAMHAALKARGLEETLAQLDASLRRARLWVATAEAHYEDALEAFHQALHLHRRACTLHRDLKAAEAALASDPSEENYHLLLDIQSQVHGTMGIDALIEGFGVASGRSNKMG